MADATQDYGPDPFASQGGGRFVQGVGWVDKNNPAYAQGSAPAGPTNTTPDQGAVPPPTASANGTSNSATPGAPPTQNTTNQGTQDTVRNTYLEQATQNPIPSANDPVIRAQTDPYNAAVERAKTNYINQQAESAGPYATGALRGQERIASEQAGQSEGQFAATAVANELQARRQQIQDALSGLSGALTGDQTRALQEQLANLDAQIQTLGITTTAGTAANAQAIQKALGIGGLNLGLIQALLQNQQFGDQLGFNVADRTAYYNTVAGGHVLQ